MMTDKNACTRIMAIGLVFFFFSYFCFSTKNEWIYVSVTQRLASNPQESRTRPAEHEGEHKVIFCLRYEYEYDKFDLCQII